MLRARDTNHPSLSLPRHRAKTGLVPLLPGGWLFNAHCDTCDTDSRAITPAFAAIPAAAADGLRCGPAVTSVWLHHHVASTAAVLARGFGLMQPIVREPTAHIVLADLAEHDPSVIAVDASVAPDVTAVAAVTGRGWVKLYRGTGSHINSSNAEAFAVRAGLELLPEGTTGTVLCDNAGVVGEINRWGRNGFSTAGHASWLPGPLVQSICGLMRDRDVHVEWARRRSTPQLAAADSLAGRVRAQGLAGAAAVKGVDWVHPGHGRASVIFYRYRTTGGSDVFDLP